MRFLAFFLLCILLSCASTSRTERIKESEANYQIGLSYMNDGKYQTAFIEFQKSIEFNPDNKFALNALGLIYLKFEDLDEAEQLFLDALDVDDRYSEAYNNLGVVYSRKKKWDKAIKQFKEALENPLYASPERAFTNLGNAYFRIKKYDLAIKNYKSALIRINNFFPAYYGLALGYNAIEQYGDAAQAMTMAIQYDPEIKDDKRKAVEVFNRRMVMTIDEDERKDYLTLIDILNY